MADGATLAQVRAELGVIAARLDEARPPFRTTLAIDRATRLSDPEERGTTLAIGTVVMAAFGLVLLIACANVANLLLARATGRAREIAVRLSLGASRARIVQQLLAESLLLGVGAGVLGSMLALWAIQSLVFLAIDALPPQAPELAIDATPDGRVLGFALLASVGSAVLFGLAPAFQASKPDLHAAMKVDVSGLDRRSGGRLRGALVGLQVAVCMVLMIAAGLLLRGLATAQDVDPGFDYENVAVASFDLTAAGYDTARAPVFQRQLAERVHDTVVRGQLCGGGAPPRARRMVPALQQRGLADLLFVDRHSDRARPRVHGSRYGGRVQSDHRDRSHGAALLAGPRPDRANNRDPRVEHGNRHAGGRRNSQGHADRAHRRGAFDVRLLAAHRQ
jgi:hypothetical protein